MDPEIQASRSEEYETPGDGAVVEEEEDQLEEEDGEFLTPVQDFELVLLYAIWKCHLNTVAKMSYEDLIRLDVALRLATNETPAVIESITVLLRMMGLGHAADLIEWYMHGQPEPFLDSPRKWTKEEDNILF